MHKKLPIILAVTFVIAFSAAVCGCTAPGHLVANTVAPGGTAGLNGPGAITLTPTPAPTTPAGVWSSGDTTTITGYKSQTATGIQLNQGVYVVQSSTSDGTALTATLVDSSYNDINLLSAGSTSGNKLIVVDNSAIYAGQASLDVTSDGHWTVTLTKQEFSSAASLPQSMTGSSSSEMVSTPFTASSGNLDISYTMSTAPGQDVYVNIYNVENGQTFYVFPMKANSQEGQITATVPTDGVYIAEVDLPTIVQYCHVTISQN